MPLGFGAKPRTPDIRDYQIGRSQAPVTIPAVYMPNHSNLPVKMQGTYGTCGGHAGAAWASFTRNIDLSPKYLWKRVKSLAGTPLTADVGVDMRDIFQALQNTGICHESLCPDTLDPSFAQYSDPSTLTPQMDDDAIPYGAANYAFTDNPSWDQIRQAIFQNGAAILLVDCGTGWYTSASGVASWAKKDICPIRLGNYIDGHFVLAWGYDEQYIYFRNSWSAAWASTTGQGSDGGDGYFGQDYVLHVKEMGIGLDAPSTNQQLISLYTKLLYALQQLYAALRSAHPAAS
jgi:hypothetical protein